MGKSVEDHADMVEAALKCVPAGMQKAAFSIACKRMGITKALKDEVARSVADLGFDVSKLKFTDEGGKIRISGQAVSGNLANQLMSSGDWKVFAAKGDLLVGQKSLEKDLDDGATCPACGGPGVLLGQLGNLMHYRCQNCGADFSTPVSKSIVQKKMDWVGWIAFVGGLLTAALGITTGQTLIPSAAFLGLAAWDSLVHAFNEGQSPQEAVNGLKQQGVLDKIRMNI